MQLQPMATAITSVDYNARVIGQDAESDLSLGKAVEGDLNSKGKVGAEDEEMKMEDV